MKSVRDVDVENKKVLLRVDFNVPIEDGKIVDNNRIKAAIPTLKYLLEQKAKVVLATHIGRPEGKVDPAFSTKPVAEELSKLLGETVETTDEIISPLVKNKIDQLKPGQAFLLGNLRFDPREKLNDESFAKELASMADIYVNDAFAVCHRADASVEAITHFLPSYAGLLLESEMTSLGLLITNPERPFVLIVGGAKVKDKAGILQNLAEKADVVLVGGAVGNTFLAATGVDMSSSKVDNEMLPVCREILAKFGTKIKLPTDFEKEVKADGTFNALDIGPDTRDRFVHEIGYGKCIFWNGNMGYTEDERFVEGTRAIIDAMIKNGNTTVIAGGDTVGFVDKNNLRNNVSFVSTGGGAAMKFLAGETLPGIAALEK